MADITTLWDPQAARGDWAIATPASSFILDDSGLYIYDAAGQAIQDTANYRGFTPGLVSGADLQTAVLISLFTDGRADPSDKIPDGSGDPRGWWGDSFMDRPIGSKLWLYARAKQTEETRTGIQGAISAALQWLLDDQVAASITVDVSWIRPGAVGSVITLSMTSGERVVLKFAWAWASVN